MSTDRKPTQNVTLTELQLADIATITGQIDRLGKSLVEAMTQRDELVSALERIRNKIDIANIRRDGKWAIQTLDAIDEIAQRALAGQAGREVTRAEGPSN
jgi:hypothetical protein